jgi:hypothetical protein
MAKPAWRIGILCLVGLTLYLSLRGEEIHIPPEVIAMTKETMIPADQLHLHTHPVVTDAPKAKGSFDFSKFDNVQIGVKTQKPKSTRPATIDDSLPSWEGIECLEGTQLTDLRLVDKCKSSKPKEKIAPYYCNMILNYSYSKSGNPPCGQYSTGKFSQPIGVPPAADLVHWKPETGCTIKDFSTVLKPGSVKVSDDFGGNSLNLTIGGADPTLDCINSFRYYTRREVVELLSHAMVHRKNLRGGILFTGDSMVRQLFLRLISFIRGEEIISEHYYHQDGLYVLWDDRDAMIPLTGPAKAQYKTLLANLFPGYLGDGKPLEPDTSLSKVVVAMMFQWDARPTQFRTDFQKMNAPLHFAAFMYWWTKKEALNAADQYMANVDSHLRDKPSDLRGRYVYITTPWTAPGTFGGVDSSIRVPRNERLTNWILTSKAKSPKYLLDFSGLADAVKLTKTADGIHYMCIWTPKYNELVNHQKENGRECSDPMNLAVVQWMMHVVAYADGKR